jgi:N-acyl-D-amino-acid deacylase
VTRADDAERIENNRRERRETILRGATVIDGTGGPARRVDVHLGGDGRIAAVGRDDRQGGGGGDGAARLRVDGADVVDLDGLVLAPGFIDPHTHYDAQVLWDPDLSPSSWHGVTTVIMGNCGFGVAPCRPAGRDAIMRTLENVEGMPLAALEAGIAWDFETFPEYLDAVDRRPKRINCAVIAGHTPLRFFVMGDEATEREATPAELAEMRAVLSDAVAAGAVGFSTTRSTGHYGAWGRPVPSRAASLDELWTLCGVLGEHGWGTVEAAWGPDFHVEEAPRLAADIGRPVSWAAIMTQAANPSYAPDIAARVAQLGGNVHPQISCRPIVVQIALSDPFPFANVPAFSEILGLAHADRATRYGSESWRVPARSAVRELWGAMLETAVVAESEVHAELVDGPTLGAQAAARGVDPLDVMVDLALAEGLATRFRVTMINDSEDQIGALLRQPGLLLGLSDAGAHTSQLCDANYATWLLQRYVRERADITLEMAVWRLTGHVASVYGLAGRGVIAAGNVADLVAFDPTTVGTGKLERVHDFPGGADRLVAPSTGIEHIWVGGVATRRGGRDVTLDQQLPGVLIRGGR